jgi:hypothetical protein
MWLILTAVIPGMFTVGILCFVLFIMCRDSVPISIQSDWIMSAVFIVIMIITQMVGLCFEKLYIRCRKCKDDSDNQRKNYEEIYKTLAKIDFHGKNDKHLERICCQFFMSCNIQVSLFFGIIAAVVCYCLNICNNTCNELFTCTFIFILISLALLMLINLFCVLKGRWKNLTDSINEYNKLLEKL